MQIDLKEEFEIIEDGTRYRLPGYEVVDGEGIVRKEDCDFVVRFVRGSKRGDEEVARRCGTLHEHLLSMMIHDLKFKNGLVPSRETSMTITKMEEALHWCRARQIDRAKRDVAGTYQK